MPTLDLSQGLSVVIPFYNEGSNTPKSAEFVLAALMRTTFPSEVIVVNDGSSDGISRDSFPKSVRYFEKNHTGRFETRYFGLNSSKYQNVLFIDARVWIGVDSLKNLEELISSYPESRYWNGYIKSADTHLATVSIWETLVSVGWGAGIHLTDTIHFGQEDFDRFPKGTTLFLATKSDWLAAFQNMGQSDSKLSPVSDDTKILRYLVKSGDIWIDNKFSAEYQPRTTLSKFLKNAFYRGKTFVDSYWESPTIFGKLVKASIPLGIVLQILFYTYGDFLSLIVGDFSLLLTVSLIFFGYSHKKWRNKNRAAKESIILIPLILSFGSGFLLAYLFGLTNRLRRK